MGVFCLKGIQRNAIFFWGPPKQDAPICWLFREIGGPEVQQPWVWAISPVGGLLYMATRGCQTYRRRVDLGVKFLLDQSAGHDWIARYLHSAAGGGK